MNSRLKAFFATAAAFAAATATSLAEGQVDPTDRSDVVRHYHEVYLSGEDYDDHHGWTGSISGCDPGTVSAELHDDVICRVNYFRAMAGLPAGITLSPELNAKCQKAALMMARNNDLAHDPPNTWYCYTADGAEAAMMSNLSSGFDTPHYGPDAVFGQIQDDGANNAPVAHRRWILSTSAPDQMGHGSIPLNPIVGDPSHQNASMALWVIGESTQALPVDFEFVAWPPAGHVPYQFAFSRWSFSIPGADFSAATVSLYDDAGNIPLKIVHRTGGGGDPTIVFEPQGFPLTTPPADDKTYTVTVSGIIGASESSYSYDVTIIDPDSMPPVELSGGDTGYVGHPSTFNFTPQDGADSYEVRVFETAEGDWSEGAENADKIIDGTEANHDLRTTSFAHGGSRSFHMIWEDESFEIDRDILPSATSQLQFEQRFRWVGNTTSLIAEVIGSSGTWTEVWRRTGTLQSSASQSNWDSAWTSVSIPLSDFDGETIRVRFRYHRDAGGYGWFPNFPGDLFHEFGALVDDLQVTDGLEIASETVVTLPAGSSSAQFTPPNTGAYHVQVRAQIAGIWFGYSMPHSVEAIIGTPPVEVLEIIATGIDATGAFYMDANASGLTGLSVQTSTDGGQTWTTDDSFTIPATSGSGIRISGNLPASGDRLFRLASP